MTTDKHSLAVETDGSDGLPARATTAMWPEPVVAIVALLFLITAQIIFSATVHGTNYLGADGKLAQATILAAFRFGRWLEVTNVSPVAGVGSQLLPMNVWLNPSYWPFAFVDKEIAADASAVIALSIFAIGCYVMARCFDVPVVPSLLAAQASIALFAPSAMFLQLSTVFCLTVGHAVVYAPYMIALGLLGRLEPGSWRAFAIITVGIAAALFYSIACDPLWSMICGFAWAAPFAVVTFASLHPRTVLVRCAALGAFFVLLLVSGWATYLYTISQYTARVQFSESLDRVRAPDINLSVLYYSPYVKYFYFACAAGWVMGLLTLRGRPRIFVLAGLVAAGALLIYDVIYLLPLKVAWRLPLPVYIEHSLFALFTATAAAGYWGLLARGAWAGRWLVTRLMRRGGLNVPHLPEATGVPAPTRVRYAAIGLSILVAAAIPVAVANWALTRGPAYAEYYHDNWSDEPELQQFLVDSVGQAVDRPYRGSIHFWGFADPTIYTIMTLWTRNIHTVEEYSQLVTPPAGYFLYALFLKSVNLNWFVPMPSVSPETFWNTLQLFGTRYFVTDDERRTFANPDKFGRLVATLPRRPIAQFRQPPGNWFVFELPNPNVGDYSPTDVTTARTGAETVEILNRPDFDFRRQVVLETKPDQPLVPAREIRLSRIRGGLHVTGRSDGTSLVILPQQFSHCLRARDARVRFVRANLMMAGMIFSGAIDTDIRFDYGLFSPACRRADLADLKQLDLKVDLRSEHLAGDRPFLNWGNIWPRLRSAFSTLN
jgi:hypothetical protein